MNSKNIKVEEVLDFLNDNKTPVLLGKYAEQELVKLGLPTSADEFDNDDTLLDDVLDRGICFFCAFGDRDYQDDVYVVGYDKDAGEILVKGCAVIGDICPVRIDELEYNSLLDLCRALRG